MAVNKFRSKLTIGKSPFNVYVASFVNVNQRNRFNQSQQTLSTVNQSELKEDEDK